MNLRPYQERAIAEARTHVGEGRLAPLIVSPTGSGKTTIGARIAQGNINFGGKVLWLAHRRELVSQAAGRLRDFGLQVGEIHPGASPFPAPVQVATVQTLLARLDRRDKLPPADLVVFDEAHHFAADEWGKLGTAYADAVRVGLTATPERGDGRGLGALFTSLIVAASVKELIAEGHLVPCEVIGPSRVLDAGQIAQDPVEIWQKSAVSAEYPSGRQTVLFAPHVKAALHYTHAFRAAGVSAELVVGDMLPQVRADILARYARGEVRVLCNVYVLTEGWDDPPTSCAILVCGAGTAGAYLQRVGRVLRPAPGKANALVLDLRGIANAHGAPDEDRVYSLDGIAIRRRDEDDARFCVVCGALIPDGEPACLECGKGPDELLIPKVVHAAVVKYAAKRRESDDERAKTLVRWQQDGRTRGYKPGWAFAKYRAVYGAPPSGNVTRLARSQQHQISPSISPSSALPSIPQEANRADR